MYTPPPLRSHAVPRWQSPNHPIQVSPRVRAAALVLSSALSTAMVWAAAAFQPASPLAPEVTQPLQSNSGPRWAQAKLGVATPSRAQWTDPVPAYIRLDEARTSRIAVPLQGRVARVFVEPGQRVARGAPLFSVTSSNLAQLEQELVSTHTVRQASRAQHQRVAALVRAHALPAREELDAALELRRADLAHAAAQARLAALAIDANAAGYYTVRAPRDGYVVTKNVLPDQQVGPDSDSNPMTIADLSSLWVVAEVTEPNARGIHPGSPAQVELGSDAARVVSSEVERVGALLDPSHHTVPLRMRLTNLDRSLKPDSYARVRLFCDPAPGAVEVAESAVENDGEQAYVYVRDPQQGFVRRNVVTGPLRNGRVTILKGLSAGEMVAEINASLLDNQIASAN